MIHCHEGILQSAKGGEGANAAYQIVVRALVDGVEVLQGSPGALKKGCMDPSAASHLRYTRDRICVPRDMSFGAARQLRAHLNWAADIIDPQPKWTGLPLS